MEWHDWWRVYVMFLCSWSLLILAHRYRHNRCGWNNKTLDYWYAFVMWSIAGFSVSLEGILRDSDFGVRLVFLLMASSITLKGLWQKGSWGTDTHD